MVTPPVLPPTHSTMSLSLLDKALYLHHLAQRIHRPPTAATHIPQPADPPVSPGSPNSHGYYYWLYGAVPFEAKNTTRLFRESNSECRPSFSAAPPSEATVTQSHPVLLAQRNPTETPTLQAARPPPLAHPLTPAASPTIPPRTPSLLRPKSPPPPRQTTSPITPSKKKTTTNRPSGKGRSQNAGWFDGGEGVASTCPYRRRRTRKATIAFDMATETKSVVAINECTQRSANTPETQRGPRACGSTSRCKCLPFSIESLLGPARS
ncbi:hypothetical protein DFJ73DRAFT_855593, partial [Zopfochytrium polystomum]